jgi:putative flippase GtrA
MKQVTAEDHVKPRQALRTRFLWFLAGAGLNYLLIATPFKWLRLHHPELPIWAVSACSIGVSTTFFFLWNYFINFRTQARKREALPRYLAAVACMWTLSSTTLTVLKHFNAQMAFSLGRFPLDLDIVATQFFLAGLKFFLYHKWVFPVPKDAPPQPAMRENELGKAG